MNAILVALSLSSCRHWHYMKTHSNVRKIDVEVPFDFILQMYLVFSGYYR